MKMNSRLISVMGLANLRSDKVIRLDDTKVAIGQWKCDLRNRTFYVSIIGKHGFWDMNGKRDRIQRYKV